MSKLVCILTLILFVASHSYGQGEYVSRKWKKPVLYSGYSLAYVGFSYQMSQHFFTNAPISPFHYGKIGKLGREWINFTIRMVLTNNPLYFIK